MNQQDQHPPGQPIRLLVTSFTFLPLVGGAELAMARLAAEFGQRRDYEVHVLSPQGPAPGVAEKIAGCTLYTLPEDLRVKHRTLYRLLFFIRLLWLAVTKRIDVIHVQWSAFPANLVRWVSAITRTPYVLTVCGADVNVVPDIRYGFYRKRRRRRRIRWNLRAAARVICKSPSLRERVNELVPGVPTVMVPNLLFFADDDTGLPPKEDLIAIIGRHDPVKNLPAALEALQSLALRQPDFRAVLIGRDTGALEPTARALGLSPRQLHFAGSQSEEEVQQWLRRAKVLLCTSRVEGSPQACFQAARYGAALVLANSPGLRDLVAPIGPFAGGCADDPAGLASLLHRCLSEPDPGAGNVQVVRSVSRTRIVATHDAVYRAAVRRDTVHVPDVWYGADS